MLDSDETLSKPRTYRSEGRPPPSTVLLQLTHLLTKIQKLL